MLHCVYKLDRNGYCLHIDQQASSSNIITPEASDKNIRGRAKRHCLGLVPECLVALVGLVVRMISV